MPPSNSAFRALADQTRRDILQALRAGPLTSGEIAAKFHTSWPTISRHLSLLREAGLVKAERAGQEIHYELNTSVFQDLVHHLMSWTAPAGRARAGRARGRKPPRLQES
jgi:DNA-binding transcriptional ArsR family regulator